MTLREAINHVMNRGAQAHIHTTIYNTYYRECERTWPDVMTAYNDVIGEILNLPSNPGDDHILINSVVRDDTDEIDVCCYSPTDDQTYAIDLMDWSDLVDLMIDDAVGLNISDQIAHVLWELTFWGFTRERIALERDKLKKASEEATETLTSLDDLGAALDDLE
jgi:hypothetical protein